MIHVKVYKSTEIDDYEKGCLLEGGYDFGLIETLKVNNLDEAMTLIKSYGEPYLFEDRLEVQVTENMDGQEAMPYQLEEWKKGNRKLMLASYSFYFSEVTKRSVKNDELKKAFPKIEEN